MNIQKNRWVVGVVLASSLIFNVAQAAQPASGGWFRQISVPLRQAYEQVRDQVRKIIVYVHRMWDPQWTPRGLVTTISAEESGTQEPALPLNQVTAPTESVLKSTERSSSEQLPVKKEQQRVGEPVASILPSENLVKHPLPVIVNQRYQKVVTDIASAIQLVEAAEQCLVDIQVIIQKLNKNELDVALVQNALHSIEHDMHDDKIKQYWLSWGVIDDSRVETGLKALVRANQFWQERTLAELKSIESQLNTNAVRVDYSVQDIERILAQVKAHQLDVDVLRYVVFALKKLVK